MKFGSPPQVRGKLGHYADGIGVIRITPAGAGKTFFVAASPSVTTDHPRRCGENRVRQYQTLLRTGSPPQVRGKQHSFCQTSCHPRTTPAGAGKTKPLALLYYAYADHPRRCGENCCCNLAHLFPHGSPPQVRGKLASRLLAPACVRITPAGAGKTRQDDTCRLDLRDHPRRCGENLKRKLRMQSACRSPPQVRGKPCWFYAALAAQRITPAGAGKTQCRKRPDAATSDHPRRCGENFRHDLARLQEAGSPPQVRGKRASGNMQVGVIRITPAGAGKTYRVSAVQGNLWDHPRRCGENPPWLAVAHAMLGSPPQVRGKLE